MITTLHPPHHNAINLPLYENELKDWPVSRQMHHIVCTIFQTQLLSDDIVMIYVEDELCLCHHKEGGSWHKNLSVQHNGVFVPFFHPYIFCGNNNVTQKITRSETLPGLCAVTSMEEEVDDRVVSLDNNYCFDCVILGKD